MNESALQLLPDLIRFVEQYRNTPADQLPDDYGQALAKVDAFYASLLSPVNPPLAVRRAIVLKFLDNLPRACDVLRRLGYDGLNGAYWFVINGMYHGVEPDGYIHT